jgi:dipeptidyl aminopeptidase/acylaminoacyl peptidase
MFILARFADTPQVHFVRAPAAYRQQLTFFPDRVLSATFCPRAESNYFVFSMDTGGAEFYQLYRFDLADGSVHLLTDGKSRNSDFLFNHLGDLAAYVSTRRNGRDYDLYLLDPLNPASERRALELKGAWVPIAWSTDDQRLLLVREVSVNESYIHVFDVATGRSELLLPSDGEKASYGPAVWSGHANGIYVISNRGSEFRKLFYYDLSTKNFTPLTDAIPWDIEGLALSPDGWTLAFAANEDGISAVHLQDTRTRREIPDPVFSTKHVVHLYIGSTQQKIEPPALHLPIGVVTGLRFHTLRNELAFTVSSAKSPSDVYSYDLDTKKLDRWTFSETGGLNPESFQEAQLIHYPTFDQLSGKPRLLAAFLTRPPAKFKPPFPVLISIHGGPEGQTRPGFQARYNYFINEMGIALLEPNVRGSTGYGKTFTDLDNGYHREDTVKDIGALLDWIKTQPDLDAGRVAVSGGSYGGYMSLATMAHYSDRLRCGIDIVGVSNFVMLLERTQSYRRDLRRVEYGDERDPKMRKFLMSISPTTNADKIRVPILVAAGKNDPRVPISLSEEIAGKVRSNGERVWYIVAKDEGHGYVKKTNVDYLQYAEVFFLQEFLLK